MDMMSMIMSREIEMEVDSLPGEIERLMDSLPMEVERVLHFPEDMENMLHPPARAYVKNTKALFGTPADVYELPDSYSFVLHMPGLQDENIKVKVENGLLHVVGTGKKGKEGDKEGVKVIRIERRKTRYFRKFKLPKDANPEDVNASYKDGVLTVVVTKKPDEEAPSKPKSITIPVS